jgi:hypothetical protein
MKLEEIKNKTQEATDYLVQSLEAPDVEDWLAGLRWQVRRSKQRPNEPDKFLPLAPGTKKKLRDVMHVLYEHAKRYGWWPEDRINPISKVRQGGERRTTPIRLNLEELHHLIYKELQQRERTRKLAQRTVKRTAEGAIFVSA